MVRKPSNDKMAASKKQSKHEVKVATNASFFYMFLWMLAAIGAITYIALLANHSLPDYLKAANLQASQDKAALSAGKSQFNNDILTQLTSGLTDTNQNLRQLNVKYYALENRLNNINNRITLIQNANDENTKRISSLDDPELKTGAITPQVIDKKQAPVEKIELPKSKSVHEKKEAETKDLKKLAASKVIELPEKQKADQKEKPANPTIMRTMFAVSLGHYPDLKNLKSSWKVLKKKHGAALGDLKPRYITLVIDNKPVYQLVSGPLNNALDAAKICNYLQQLKTYCRQTVFHGSDI